MSVLIFGVVLWWVAHLQKSVMPRLADALTERLGEERRRGVMAGLILLSVILMIVGYRMAPDAFLYDTPSWAVHVNNLLMLVVIFLLGVGRSSGRARCWLRHPMLLGVLIWGLAHLMVNGDLASLILFGGLAAWSVVSMLTINRRDGAWVRPEPGPTIGDVKHIALTIIIFAVFAGVHHWIGPSPFPGL
jgi:uncharacterized membrane protein